MTGKDALWQQASRKCVSEYGIETQYSRDHGMDCEYGGVWDCEKCWNSEAVGDSGTEEKRMTEKQRDMIEGMNKLLKRFNVYPNERVFTVEEIIKVSNEVYWEILEDEKN